MDWVEICVEINVSDLDEASAIANMTVPYGIYIEDYSELEDEVMQIARIDLIDEELLSKDRSIAKIHIYIDPQDNIDEAVSFLRERLSAAGIAYTIDTGSVKEEDWRNNWRQYFKPMPVGERLLINPSWYTNVESDGRAVLNIDPGLAFGTGKHETTRLCLEAIESYLRPGDAVLDVGCGSGILGIAAALLGASSVLGVDIDELAVRTAAENAAINNADGVFTAVCGDLVDKVEGKYDLIVANIVADAIIALSASIKAFLKPGAFYIVSGVIDARAEDVRTAVSGSFDIIEEKTLGGWYCFVLRSK